MKSISVTIFVLCCLVVAYLTTVNHTEANEVAITWNFMSGELALQDNNHAGYHFTVPWVKVARIDTRPARVCITSNTRAFNCKLVQFVPSAYKEFVSVQGFYYYWWTNRISFNLGYNEEYRGVRDILRGYAFGIKQYSFLKILRDFDETQ